ncbi:lysophospholipid acyltransferase family protein [Paraliomyxa miuraensis]|uniref:lysophospholipid acyltransferase family protein n=1 Tax=Paraliomyxa miuraensis TaxID=376150 RepID=UPI00225B85AB|nr:lysophospholipid acyltransferase family protein [Paraliomyxa miuraensis]MCX4240693.1 1-acyl-sn-glycerol-3-phosphate acyltransferase [Paraliomyxa miuraensis]
MLARLGTTLFSLVYWPLAFALMLVGALLTLALLVVRFPYQRVHVWVTAPLFVGCVPLSFTRMRVHYHPDFDPETRSVYIQNHINLLDGMVASAVIPHAFSGLMNAWQFKIPIYGWLMSMSKGIPVHRGRRDLTLESISKAARERKRIGMSVLTFPEGHRSPDGKVRPFRRGVFMMARNAEMPVVPITVRGMHEVNRKGSMLFHPGRTVDVFVGPQHDPSGLSDQDLLGFAERLRGFMSHCLEHGRWPETSGQSRAAE